MDISRLKFTRSVSSSSVVSNNINQKSHHNISREQPHRAFSLMTQTHQHLHSSSATTSTNTNTVLMSLTPSHSSSSKKTSKTQTKKYGKDSYLDDNDDWLANVGEYTIENEDKFIQTDENETSFYSLAIQNDEDSQSKDVNGNTEQESENYEQDSQRRLNSKFHALLYDTNMIKLSDLRDISWHGIPLKYKSLSWKLLLGYLPPNIKRHEQILKQKRKTYKNGILQSITNLEADGMDMEIIQVNEKNKQTWHQVKIDLKRTHPDIMLYQFPSVKDSLQRILYYWALRRPTTGYVQGINDICTTFYQVFLLDYYKDKDLKDWSEIEKTDPKDYMTMDDFYKLESDTFWCFDKFLESIMDNYVHGQPGILRQVSKLENICKRIDPDLYNHFAKEQVEFFQFSFRWMNCLLMREVPMRVVLRMWDTYLAESSSDQIGVDSGDTDPSNDYDIESKLQSLSQGTRNNSIFNSNQLSNSYEKGSGSATAVLGNNNTNTRLNEFHVYVCCAFLEKWATTLETMDFTGIIMFLQSCPTTDWNEKDIEMLLSEAFLWQSLFKDSTQ